MEKIMLLKKKLEFDRKGYNNLDEIELEEYIKIYERLNEIELSEKVETSENNTDKKDEKENVVEVKKEVEEKVNTFINGYSMVDKIKVISSVDTKKYNLEANDIKNLNEAINFIVEILDNNQEVEFMSAVKEVEDFEINEFLNLYEYLSIFLTIKNFGVVENFSLNLEFITKNLKTKHSEKKTKGYFSDKFFKVGKIKKLCKEYNENIRKAEIEAIRNLDDTNGGLHYLKDYISNTPTEKDYILPPTYEISDNSIQKNLSNGSSQKICDTVIFLNEIFYIESIDTERKYYVELMFLDNNEWITITVDKETIYNNKKILSLANKNVAVNSDNANLISNFLSDFESVNKPLIPVRKHIENGGWTDDGELISSNGIFTPYGEETVRTFADKPYYCSLKFLKSIPFSIVNPLDKGISHQKGINNTLKFLNMFSKTHDLNVTLPMLSYIFSSSIFHFTKNTFTDSSKPILIGTGASANGKSIFLSTLMKILNLQEKMSMVSNSVYGLKKSVCDVNCLAQVHDEYKPSGFKGDKMLDIDNMIKSLYDNNLELKGNPNKKDEVTQQIGTDKYHFQRSLIIFGEGFPTDRAVLERLLMVEITPNTSEQYKNFNELLNFVKVEDIDYAMYYIYSFLMAYVKENDYQADLKQCLDIIKSDSRFDGLIERVKVNLAYNLHGCLLLDKFFEFYGSEFEYEMEDFLLSCVSASKHISDDTSSPINKVLIALSMHHKRIDNLKQHVKVVHDVNGCEKGLFVSKNILEEFVKDSERYRIDTQIDVTILRNVIEKEKKYLAKSMLVPKIDKNDNVSMIHRRRIKSNSNKEGIQGYIFDIDKMEQQLNIEATEWDMYADKTDFLNELVNKIENETTSGTVFDD